MSAHMHFSRTHHRPANTYNMSECATRLRTAPQQCGSPANTTAANQASWRNVGMHRISRPLTTNV